MILQSYHVKTMYWHLISLSLLYVVLVVAITIRSSRSSSSNDGSIISIIMIHIFIILFQTSAAHFAKNTIFKKREM